MLQNYEPSIELQIVNGEINTTPKQGDVISKYQIQILNLINKIITTELKSKLNNKVNHFKFTVKSYDGYLWILGYKTAENLINIIRSVSNNFSHPFFGNKIETKQMSQMSGATEFIQYFSKTIDNDIDWRPTDTVPEDHYG